MFIKRLFTKVLPVTSFLFLFIFYVNQKTVPDRRQTLVETLQQLQDSQIINTARQFQRFNASSAVNESQAEGDELMVTTRKWFDDRPKASPSLKSYSGHPHFPGFIIENSLACQDESVDVLIYLHSAPKHREERMAIRETWGSTDTFFDIRVKLIFILGRTHDRFLQLQLETEYSTYGDIVQGDFLDVFSNLTYKALTMLTWVNTHCPQAKYIMKADDDMFVDTYAAIRDIVPQLASKNFAAACDYKINMPITRSASSKWCVPKNIVPERTQWPPFCAGYFTMFTGNLIPSFYEASFVAKDFVPGDDVYLFGLLPEQNITYDVVNIREKITAGDKPKAEEEVSSSRKFQHLAFRVHLPGDQKKLWSVRCQVLSKWEKSHSYYHHTFQRAKDKGILLV